MRRREFITLVSITAAAWPLRSRAQQSAMPVVGFLNAGAPDGFKLRVAAFRQGLEEAGYIEGRYVNIEYRWAEGHYDRLPAMATDLIQHGVAVLAATSTPAVLVAKASTKTIPIVFTTGSDPVELGLVASWSQPGGNLTGASELSREVAPKRLELAHQLVPTATVVGLLINPQNPVTETVTRDLQAAASALGLQFKVLNASTEAEIDQAFTTFGQTPAGVLVIGTDTFFAGRAQQIGALSIRHLVPTIYQYREFAVAGGLAGYGGGIIDAYRLAGGYTGRILKGEKPANLPIQQSSKAELIINLGTAKAFGITVPDKLLATADEVIE
jgi:putative tryptophan/tyrosine transport system substrate-binding protein